MNHEFPDDRSLAPDAAAAPAADEPCAAIDRIIDCEESPEEWRCFVSSANAQPALWRDLACGQRRQRLLSGALSADIERVVRPDLIERALLLRGQERGGLHDHCVQFDRHGDVVGAIPSTARQASSTPSAAPSATGLATGSGGAPSGARLGWALAACVAGAWIVSAGIGSRRSAPPSSADIQPAAFLSPDQALDAYLQLGRESGSVVGELPGKPIIERRALDGGAGFEVVFVRQIVERSRVPALYSFDRSNEFGAPVPAPVENAVDRRNSL